MELKNRKADDMCYKRIRFHFLSISILIFSLTLAGCSKDEILDQYNSVVQTAGNAALTSNFLLKGNRTYGEDCYTGTYTADYKDFSKTEYLFGGTSIERENGKDISVSCDLEITEGTAQVFWISGRQPCFSALILRWLWKTKLPFLFGKLKWNGLNQEAN